VEIASCGPQGSVGKAFNVELISLDRCAAFLASPAWKKIIQFASKEAFFSRRSADRFSIFNPRKVTVVPQPEGSTRASFRGDLGW